MRDTNVQLELKKIIREGLAGLEAMEKKTKCKHEWRQLLTNNLFQTARGGCGRLREEYYCVKCLEKRFII